MEDYPALVETFNRWMDRLEQDLATVEADLEDAQLAVASPAPVTEARDQIHERLEDLGEEIAAGVQAIKGEEYGTFSVAIDDDRWELKYDDDGSVSYLRVGGRGGTYLISQYGPPSPSALISHMDEIVRFVETYNDWVAEQAADLSEHMVDVPTDILAGASEDSEGDDK